MRLPPEEQLAIACRWKKIQDRGTVNSWSGKGQINDELAKTTDRLQHRQFRLLAEGLERDRIKENIEETINLHLLFSAQRRKVGEKTEKGEGPLKKSNSQD